MDALPGAFLHFLPSPPSELVNHISSIRAQWAQQTASRVLLTVQQILDKQALCVYVHYEKDVWRDVILRFPWPLVNLALCRAQIRRSVCTQTHKHEFTASPWQHLVNQKWGYAEFTVHTFTQQILSKPDRWTHFLSIISIFLHGALLSLQMLFRPLEKKKSFCCLLYLVFKGFHGQEMTATNAHEHNKQKWYQIFMQLKQGWELQCKQIKLYLLLGLPQKKV